MSRLKFWFNMNKVNLKALINDGALNFPDPENKTLSYEINHDKDFNDLAFLKTNGSGMKLYSPRPQSYNLKPKEFYSRIVKIEKRDGVEYANIEFQFSNYTEDKKEANFILCYLYFNYYEKMENLLKSNFNLSYKLSDEINIAKEKYREQKNNLKQALDLSDLILRRNFNLSINELMGVIIKISPDVNLSLSMIKEVKSFLNITVSETIKYTTIKFNIKSKKIIIDYIATNNYSDNNSYVFRNVNNKFQIEREIKSKEKDFNNVYITIFDKVAFKVSDNVDEIIVGFKKKMDPFFIKDLESKIIRKNRAVSFNATKNYKNEVCDALFSNNNLSNIEKSLALQILELEAVKYKYYQFMLSEEKSFDNLDKNDIQTLCMFYPEVEELFNYLIKQSEVIINASNEIKKECSPEVMVSYLEPLK